MELADIKSRDDLRRYWQQVLNRPVWNAAEVEADRQALLAVAKALTLPDWERYLEAREGYNIDPAASVTRLSAFMDWARKHRESIEEWLFAHGLFSLGVMLGKCERPDDALRHYDELIDGFKKNSDKAIVLVVARALLNAGYYAGKSGDSRAVDKYLKELRKLAKAHDEPAIRKHLADALFNAGTVAGNAGDLQTVGQCLDELRQLATAHDEPAIRERLAQALFNAVNAAGNSGDLRAVSQHLDELRHLAKAHDEPAIREPLAMALVNAGNAAGNLGDLQAVSQYLMDLRQLAEDDGEPVVREQLANALFNAGYYAGNAGDLHAVGSYVDELRELAKAHDEPDIREPLAKALFNAGYYAVNSDDSRAMGQYLKELRQLAEDHDEPAIRKNLAIALFNNSIWLDKSNDTPHAYEYCAKAEGLLQGFSDEETKTLREQVAIHKNRLRNKLGKPEEDLQESQPGEHLSAGEGWASGQTAGTSCTAFWSESDQATRAHAQTLATIPRVLITQSHENVFVKLSDAMARARMIQAHENVITEFKEVKERFLAQMNRSKQRVGRFLDANGRFVHNASVLMVLRQWNSFTPIIVDGQEFDRGGGYFLRHRNVGLVIDPGYNFIELFHKAGCKIVDITHVAITHAHDDHTAQLEQLLTMFHQFHSKNKGKTDKVTLLLNHSTLKKFSGFSLHKDCPYIEKVICLNAFDKDNEQTISLSKVGGLFLTVLPAYHDDVFTMEYAIGLGLRIDCATGVRRIVFTGDTGLYPPKFEKDGTSAYWNYTDSMNREVKERRVIEEEDEGINRKYPDGFKPPYVVDLLVPHLGSIKEYEFDPPQFKPVSSEPTSRDALEGGLGPMFYPNHLGILGTGMVINELKPRAVILSEFGSELKGLRMEIATLLRKALEKTMGKDNVPFIIPGDPSIVYNIPDGTFLCHGDGRFYPPGELEAKEVGGDRIGLFKKSGSYASLDRFDNYREDLLNSGKVDTEPFELPYMRKEGK